MKISFLLILLTIFISSLSAQSTNEEIDYIQSLYGMEKKALVAEVIRPDGMHKTAFWKLYDEYEIKRKEIGKKRLKVLISYGDNFETLTVDQAAALLKQVLRIRKQNDKLLESYVKKVAKTTGPNMALQFHQIEMYILSEIRLALAEALPYPEVRH